MPNHVSKAKRSYIMSCIRSKHTKPEILVSKTLHQNNIRFRKHVVSILGKPDLSISIYQIAIFIDGDFWHGWNLPRWKSKLSEYWKNKIEGNRKRDNRNFRKLRKSGWLVLRVWEHQLERNKETSINKILYRIKKRPIRWPVLRRKGNKIVAHEEN